MTPQLTPEKAPAGTVGTVIIGLGTSRPARSKFLRGPDRAKIETQLREHLKPWGLPLDRYRFTVERSEVPTYQDGQGHWQGWYENIPVCATFTHRSTGARIVITEIWLGDDGEILQLGSQYGDLTLSPALLLPLDHIAAPSFVGPDQALGAQLGQRLTDSPLRYPVLLGQRPL